MAEIELRGLAGTNPLGLFAALGLINALTRIAPADAASITLRWIDAAVPTAVVEGMECLDDVVAAVMADRERWQVEPVFEFEGIDDLKLEPETLVRYITGCHQAGPRSAELCAALVTERVVDGKGTAKPSDLHFTAGQQKWLAMARQIRDGLAADDVQEALEGPWRYPSDLPSLMWDVGDDRVYALAAKNPSGDKKRSEPGAEWLALLGLSSLPVTIGPDRTLTPGVKGTWKYGAFRWPLWSVPLGHEAIRSLLASVADPPDHHRLTSLGCFSVLRSTIRRSEQGGYGTFAPAEVLWQRHRTAEPTPDPFAGTETALPTDDASRSAP